MALPKGVSGNPNGRPKGTPNKITTDLKQMILNALEKAGGEEYLRTQAFANPQAFMPLLGKVLPKEVKAEVEAKMNVTIINEFE